MTKKQKKENLEKQSKIMLVIFTFLGITMLATIISTNFLAKGTYSAASCTDFGLNECPEDEGCSIELVGLTMKCVGTYTGNQTPKPTVTPNTTPTPTSGFNQTACADEADEQCGTSNWSGCRTSYNYTCNSTFTNECNVSVSTVSKHVSVTSDGAEDENSYYVVNVSYTGNGCKNQTITYTATNAKALSTTSYRIVSSTDGTTQFSVYPADDCDASMATATLTNGNHDETDSVTTKTDWVSYSVCEENPDYMSFEAADAAGADHYYSNPGTCTANGVQKNAYTVKWVRYGCGGGNYDTSTPTPSPTPTSTPKPSSTPTPSSTSSSTPTPTLSPTPTSSVKKCYVCSKNNKSQYVWATSNSAAANSATQLTGVTANNCTITDNSNCTIIPTSNCYECNVNGTNKHIWTTSEELAKQQTGANSCKIVETKACNSITPPPTGTVALIIAWIIGMMTIGYAMWYFEKTNS